MREKIAKLQTEARDELFSVLTSEQQAKLKAMTGKPFTFTGGGFGGAAAASAAAAATADAVAATVTVDVAGGGRQGDNN